MTDRPASPASLSRLPGDVRGPRPWLSVLVVAAVGVSTYQSPEVRSQPLVAALAAVSLVGWLLSIALPEGRARLAVAIALPLVGAVGAGLGASPLIAPLIGGLVLLIGRLEVRVPVAAVGGLVAALLTAVLCWATGQSVEYALVMQAGALFGVLLGVSRRGRRTAEVREQELLARSIAAEREAARAGLLEERQAAARDVHDVLAHGLGGLVVQLDAIEALLEHGRTEEATVRAAAARRLAGESLAEARRAVTALREPDAARPAMAPVAALSELTAAHRDLGGTVTVEGDAGLDDLDRAHREALVRALQEALSNARRHAPGAPVRVVVRREPSAVRLVVRTALPAAPVASAGGGHGLIGMRERFAALGDGSAAAARREGGDFVVDARAVTT